MKYKETRLSLPFEIADNVLVANLKWQIKQFKKDNKRLSKLDELADYQAEDFNNNKKFIKSAKVVLEYYGH